jgi:hypothetical protein
MSLIDLLVMQLNSHLAYLHRQPFGSLQMRRSGCRAG